MEKFFFASLRIFLWIIIGGILKAIISTRKSNYKINNLINILSTFIVYAIIPFFVGMTIWEIGIKKETSLQILLFFGFIMLSSYVASKTIKFYSLKETFFPLTFMNTLYLGIPVTEYFISKQAIYYNLIYAILVTLIQFTLGVFIISPNLKSIRFIISSPVIYTSILGWLFNKYNIVIPYFLIKIKEIISLTLSPTMLIFIGYNFPWKNFSKNIRLHVFINVIRILYIFFFCLLYVFILKNFFVLDEKFIKTLIFISVLPSAIINYVILKHFEINTDFVAGEIFWGTAVTLFLLPYLAEFTELFLLMIK